MFVAAKDFDYGNFTLPGLSEEDAGVFDAFVSTNEEINLRKLFGSLFYDAFVKGLNALPSDLDLWNGGDYISGKYAVFVVDNIADYYRCILDTTAKQDPTNTTYWTKQTANRWIRLKFGDSFTYNKLPHKWYGMKTVIVPMIYSLWVTKKARTLTKSGVITTSNENSNSVNPNDEIIKGWKEWARLCGGQFSRGYLFNNWVNANWYTIKDTLFGYLYSNSTTFDDLVTSTDYSSFQAYLSWNFINPGRMNHFDL